MALRAMIGQCGVTWRALIGSRRRGGRPMRGSLGTEAGQERQVDPRVSIVAYVEEGKKGKLEGRRWKDDINIQDLMGKSESMKLKI